MDTDSIAYPGKQVLLIKAPKEVKDSLPSFSAFFSDLHKLVGATKELLEHERTISFEVYLQENYFEYRIVASRKLTPIIIPLLYTKFNELEISEAELVESRMTEPYRIVQFGLKRSKYFPLKTTLSPMDDPYIVMAAIVSKLEHFHEGITLQVLLVPITESWLKQFIREKFFFIVAAIHSVYLFLEKPFLERDSINYYEEVKRKYSQKLFAANVRIMVSAPEEEEVQEDVTLMIKALEKLDNSNINALQIKTTDKEKLTRLFIDRQFLVPPIILNTHEVAAIFHFPDTSLNISNVVHVSSKRIEPPKHLPTAKFLDESEVSSFGVTNFRDNRLEFGIKRADRNRHLYIIGKTGMGKSKLIELLAISDIYSGKGLCVIDPHGDLATDILQYIPKERIGDVIYFHPADRDFPMGFNPLSCQTPEAKHQVVIGFIAIFKKQFAHNWTNRLEHMLRFILLALLEVGEATVIDIVRLLTDVAFRQHIVARLSDPVVKNFWTHEFASWNEKFDNEAIIPIINHVGQFIANDYIRNVVGQKQSAFDFYTVMAEGKIVIINIAKGKLGEENTALLGSMIITKIQEATMARVNLPQSKRRDFYLYVDEFQHFATEAFNQILSEARKFNVSLAIAHQYLDQLSESIRKTVFGNIGSFVSFRVGPEDANFLRNEFAPHVTQDDLVNLDFRDMYVKISIDGKASEPFSGATLDVPSFPEDYTQAIVTASRTRYTEPKTEVMQQLAGSGKTLQMLHEITEEESSTEPQFEEPIV